MRIGRFFLAALCGAACTFWAIFLASTFFGDGSGQIHWTGVVYGKFLPGYFIALYVPPILAVTAGYLALRRKSVMNAAD